MDLLTGESASVVVVVIAMSAQRRQLAVRGARIQRAMTVFIAWRGTLVGSWNFLAVGCGGSFLVRWPSWLSRMPEHVVLILSGGLDSTVLAGRILLVDDICGTGATFHALRPAMGRYLTAGATVHTVVLCRNAGAAHDPDLWLWTVDDWVRFPWEPALPAGMAVEDLALPRRVQPAMTTLAFILVS